MQCSLLIYSETNRPEQTTAILGIQPSRVVEKGEPLHCSSQPHSKRNGWFLVWECDIISEMDQTLQKLLKLCLEKKTALSSIQDAEVSIRCHVSSEYGQKGYELSKETVFALAKMGVGLQITIFFLWRRRIVRASLFVATRNTGYKQIG